MNSLLNPQTFNICTQISSLDSLRKYSNKTLTILKKLQRQWEYFQENQQRIIQSRCQVAKIKHLFGCYELIIIEFNEYCEALQITSLGKCMIKIFIQIMSIVQSILKSYVQSQRTRTYEDDKKKSTIQPTANQTQTYPLSTGYPVPLHNNSKEKNFFVNKQRSKLMAQSLDNELNQFSTRFSDAFLDKIQVEFKKNQRKVFQMQASNAQPLIQQATNLLTNKYNSLVDFISLRDKSLDAGVGGQYKQDQKTHNLTAQGIEKIYEKKTNKAIYKLMTLFENYHKNQQKDKRQFMQQQSCQTDKQINRIEEIQNSNLRDDKKNKQIKHLKLKIKAQQQKYKLFQKSLKEKTEFYQSKLLESRNESQAIQNRLRYQESKYQKMIRQNQNMGKSTKQEKVQNEQRDESIDQGAKQQNKENQQQCDFALKNKRLTRHPRFIKTSLKSKSVKKYQVIEQNEKEKQIVLTQSKSKNLIFQHQKICYTYAPTIFVTEEKNKLYYSHHKSNNIDYDHLLYDIKVMPRMNSEIQDSTKKQTKLLLKKYKKNIEFNKKPFSFSSLKNKTSQVNASTNQTLKNNQTMQTQNKQPVSSILPLVKQQGKTTPSLHSQANFDINDLYIGNDLRSKEEFVRQKQTIVCKLRLRIPEKVIFETIDIQNLFSDQKKAYDFETFSYALGTYHRNIESSGQKKLKRLIHKPKSNQRHFIKAHSVSLSQQFPQILHKQLACIKCSDKGKYEKIRNFFRYPFSSINKQNEQQWTKLSKIEEDIDLQQLRKFFIRIQKIHAHCSKTYYSCMGGKEAIPLCIHIQEFTRKLGISFKPVFKQDQ